MKHLLYTAFLMLGALSVSFPSLYGQGDELFMQANLKYEQKDYAGAIAIYDSLFLSGYEAADAYYNLGNAHYQLGHIAPAILNYERALMLAPTHEDATFNLELANLRVVDRITPNPEFFIMASWRKFRDGRSSGEWALWVVTAVWIAFVLGLLFLFSQKGPLKRLGFFGAIGMLLLALGFGIIAMNRHYLETHSQYAIITATNVYVKNAPDNNGTDLFILHEGTKVRLSDQLEAWREVTLSDGKEGWVLRKNLSEI